MDQQDFIEHLQKFADLVKWKRDSAAKYYEPVEVGPGHKKIQIKDGKNPTLPIIIKKLKEQPKPCADCGLIVKNRVIDIRAYELGPVRHYRSNCSVCRKTRDPYTGLWTLACRDAPKVYAEYYAKKSKLDTKSKGPDK